MIAYNGTWLNNIIVHEAADNGRHENDLSAEELANIKAHYPVGFYTPNAFIRIGLFVLTLVIAFFSYGLLTLMMADFLDKGIAGMIIFFGLITYAALEAIINSKKHYQSGVDDALLWLASGMVLGGICYGLNTSELLACVFAFVISLLATLRYTDSAMSVVTTLSFVGIVFFTCNQIGGVVKAIVPFVLMAVSALLYFGAKKLAKMPSQIHYTQCSKMVEITSLLLLYISGNYFAVRELSDAMFGLNLSPSDTIPFGWLFWLFTFLIPGIYLLFGIRLKDVVLLRVGLILFAAIIFTVRYYHAVMPIEVLMTLGGMLLLTVSYLLIRWLKIPRHGFTSAEIQPSKTELPIQIESLVIAETFAAPATSTNATQFGGGSFGGGGAGGEF
jgi:hypothetical protein